MSMTQGRGDWHKWKTRVERQRSAFRDSERRSLVLVPTEKKLAQVERAMETREAGPFGGPHALTPDPSPGVPGEGRKVCPFALPEYRERGARLERELDLRAEHVAVHAGDEAGRGLAAGGGIAAVVEAEVGLPLQ